MPVKCPGGQKPRFRVKKTKKGNVRLAFCGNKVVEAKKIHVKGASMHDLVTVTEQIEVLPPPTRSY